MKNMLQLFCLNILFTSFSFSQNNELESKDIKYFDENYKQISETEFEIRKKKKQLLSVEGDSINHKILSPPGYQGTIENKEVLDSLLTSITNKKVDSSKTLVIIFHPGKDECNSSGSATYETRKIWFEELETKLFKITQTKPIYIYKDKDGIEKYNGLLTWHKDPDRIIESLFFKYHYPCSSFVVISKTGEFKSSFGEITKEYIWHFAKSLTKKVK
jgi:hypothetical protein